MDYEWCRGCHRYIRVDGCTAEHGCWMDDAAPHGQGVGRKRFAKLKSVFFPKKPKPEPKLEPKPEHEPPKERRRSEKQQRCIEMMTAGYTLPDISKETGVSQGNLWTLAERENLEFARIRRKNRRLK